MSRNTGVFTISIDTELAWGTFDISESEGYEKVYERTPQVIDKLCKLFEEYEISATWAVVGHLLEDCTDERNPHKELTAPSYDWIDNWFQEVPCARDITKDIWHFPDLVDRINECHIDHELALHGYTHIILGAEGCSRAAANDELATAIDVARSNGFEPNSYVFPRNEIGHMDVLSDYGIEIYRGGTKRPYVPSHLPEALQKPFRFLVEAMMLSPRTVTPRKDGDLIAIPGSQIFRPRRGGWQYTPRRSQYRRARKGLEKAAKSGQIFHLWFHPFNLALDTNFLLTELEAILEKAKQLRDTGDLEILTMEEIKAEYDSGRWSGLSHE